MQESSLYKDKSSTKDFLVSKSEGVVFEVPNDCVDTSFLNRKFKTLIPEELVPEKFSEYTKNLERFSVISVHPDSLPDSDICQHVLFDIATIINDIADLKGGFWGILNGNIFTLTLPHKNSANAIKIAKKIRTELTVVRDETVSIGIANFPELSFKKDIIIENSVKALEHSCFFQGNAIVSFDGVSLNISGDRYYQRGEIEKAIDEFENAIKLSPNNVNVRNSLGICYGIQNRLTDAFKEFEEAINLDPNEIMAIHNAGLICSIEGNSEKALQYFLKADTLGQNIFEVKFHIGKLYFECGNFKRSIKYLKDSIEMDGTPLAYYYIAESQFKTGEYNDAIINCKKAVKISPNYGKAISLLSELFFKIEENIEITILFAKHSVSLEPDNGLFRKRLGKLLYMNKDNQAALKEFEIASSLNEDVSEYIDQLRLKSA